MVDGALTATTRIPLFPNRLPSTVGPDSAVLWRRLISGEMLIVCRDQRRKDNFLFLSCFLSFFPSFFLSFFLI